MTVFHFISDLHLDASRPALTECLLGYLSNQAKQAEHLFILGDLFDAWLGDDAAAGFDDSQRVAHALHALSQHGTEVSFMHGNRDFLLGDAYAQQCGMNLLDDPCVLPLHDVPTLLSHGDLLCTKDVAYLAFRDQVRDPEWQTWFLGQSIGERIAFAKQARAQSQEHTQNTDAMLMDVTPEAVAEWFVAHDVTQMIHGHTHRPATHTHDINGQACTRHVLADWRDQGFYHALHPDGSWMTHALPTSE